MHDATLSGLSILIVEDEALLRSRCKDTAQDDRGFIMTLEDSDIEKLVNDVRGPISVRYEYAVLRERFRQLVD